jgi:hypothetical protein
MEKEDVTQQSSKWSKKRINFILITAIILIVVLSLVYYFFFYGANGEIQMTVEAVEDHIQVNSTFSVRVTITNIGETGVRIIKPELSSDLELRYPNGTLAKTWRTSRWDNLGWEEFPEYHFNDLYVLSPGKSTDFIVTFYSSENNIDIPGNYTIKGYYESYNYSNLIVSMWKGYIYSDIVTFTVYN